MTNGHLTSMAIPLTSAEDVNIALSKCSSAEIHNLAHHVAHHICLGSPLNYNQYSKHWTSAEWWNVTDFLFSLFKTAIKHSWSKEQVVEELGTLPENTKENLFEVITVHRDALHHHFKEQTTAISQNILTDFDWQLKLVMSSDKMASLHIPLLNLDMQIKNSDNENKIVSLEMDQKDVKTLLSALESAGKVLQQLTV